MSLIERRWTNTVIVEGKSYVLAQEAQVELRDTNRAAWNRVKEAEQQLEGAVQALNAVQAILARDEPPRISRIRRALEDPEYAARRAAEWGQ